MELKYAIICPGTKANLVGSSVTLKVDCFQFANHDVKEAFVNEIMKGSHKLVSLEICSNLMFTKSGLLCLVKWAGSEGMEKFKLSFTDGT